jgi:hypothetical protein
MRQHALTRYAALCSPLPSYAAFCLLEPQGSVTGDDLAGSKTRATLAPHVHHNGERSCNGEAGSGVARAAPQVQVYPWSEWLDGSNWELTPGEDFSGKVTTFRSIAVAQGKKRGGRVRTRMVKAHNGEPERLYVRFESERSGQQATGSYGSRS